MYLFVLSIMAVLYYYCTELIYIFKAVLLELQMSHVMRKPGFAICKHRVPLLHIVYFQVYKLYPTPLSVLWCLCYILLYFSTSRFTSCTQFHCPCYGAFATYCSTFLLPGLQVVLNSIVRAMVPLLHIALFFYFQVYKLYSTPLSVLWCLCYILLYFSTSRFTSCTQLHCPCYGAFATYCSTFLLPGLQVVLNSIVRAMVPLLHIALFFYFQVYKLYSTPLSLHCPCYGAFATYCSTFLLPGLQVVLNSIVRAMVPLLHIALLFYFQVYKLYATPLSVLWCLCYILLYFSTSRFTSCTQLHCPCYGAFATYCSIFLLPGLQVVLNSIVRAMVPLLHIALLFYFQVYKLYSTPLSVLWCLCYILLYFSTSRFTSCTQLHCPCYGAFATYCSTFLLPGLQVILNSIVRAMVPLLHIALFFYFQVYKLYSTPLSVLWCLCYILLYFSTSRFTSCTQLHCPCYGAFATYCSTFLLPGLQVVRNSIVRAMVPLLHIALLFYFQVYKLYSPPLSVLWCLCYILLYFSTSRFTSCTQLHCPCYGAFATYCSTFLLPGLQVVLNSIVRAMVPLLHIALLFYFQVYKLYSTPLSVLWCLCYILLYFSTSRFTSCTQLHCPCYGAFATYCSTFLLPGLQVVLNSIVLLWCLCYILLYFSTSRFTSCTQLHCPCYGAFATYCSTCHLCYHDLCYCWFRTFLRETPWHMLYQWNK